METPVPLALWSVTSIFSLQIQAVLTSYLFCAGLSLSITNDATGPSLGSYFNCHKIYQCIRSSRAWRALQSCPSLEQGLDPAQRGDILRGSLQFSHSVKSNSLQPHGLQHARPPCPSPAPRAYTNSCPLSRWCHPTISSSPSPSPPTFNLSQHQSLFKWISSSYQVAKVLEFQLQHQSFQWIFRADFL